MRNKRILPLFLALVLCIGAFSTPVKVSAAENEDTTPPTLTVTPKGENVTIVARDSGSGVEAVYMDGKLVPNLCNGSGTVAIQDYVTIEKTVGVYAVDYAGNRSEMVFFNSPDPNAAAQATQPSTPKPTQPQSSQPVPTQPAATEPPATTAPAQSNPLTPDGTGSILDEATGDDDKQFYTITTAAGNVFYLIVDGQRDSENVYFLNGVTEEDLMALAEESNGAVSVVPAETCSCVDKCEAGNVYTGCTICMKDLRGCLGKEKPTEETQPPTEPVEEPESSGNGGMVLLALVSMALVAGIGYYVKIELPKQRAQDEDDFEDDGYGEGFDPSEAFSEDSYLPEDDENL